MNGTTMGKLRLKYRLSKLEHELSLRRVHLPAKVLILPPEQQKRVMQKEGTRANESGMFYCRGTPTHAWKLTEQQIEVATQMILDEVYPDIQSPYDKQITEDQRRDVEETVRQQMGASA